MGAGNILRVYHAWSSTLTAKPLCMLAYMATIARDNDAEPWYGLGHEDLAHMVLGLTVPSEDEDPKLRATQLRKVRRHITALHNARAITTRDRATFGALGTSYVVYRLHLDGPAPESAAPASAPERRARP